MIASIAPYLYFSNNCQEAFKFYAEGLGGEISSMMKVGDGPKEYHDPAHLDSVMHAVLRVGNFMIMGSDTMGHPLTKGTNITVMIDFTGEGDIEKAWKH